MSCDTCQLSFFDLVLKSRDSGFSIYPVNFDFTKAFDRVDHDLLLLKLASFGIGETASTARKEELRCMLRAISLCERTEEYQRYRGYLADYNDTGIAMNLNQPPGTDIDADTCLLENIKEIDSHPDVVLMGDFNAPSI
ncbi:unnamed protein product [Schistocephalus solidus]|uniref:Reverse transcriptase domain-containing protein n=1 Tax=Schistocephalus solidus TaxID=70667 RepID=A0A183TTR9_SCHSO|nr:unnamed protein product [Schistocephalus solidus]